MTAPVGIPAAVVALLVFALPSLGQSARIDRIDLLEAGLYRAERAGQMETPGSVTGSINRLSRVDFYELTSRVPAQVGIRFGVRFRVIGTPEKALVRLRTIWRLPGAGLREPSSGRVYRESDEDFTTPIGEPRLRGYGFDNDWELVPGDWAIEIWHEQRRLLTHTFTVYRP